MVLQYGSRPNIRYLSENFTAKIDQESNEIIYAKKKIQKHQKLYF